MGPEDFRALVCRHCRRWRVEHGRSARGFAPRALRCPIGSSFFESSIEHQREAGTRAFGFGVSGVPRTNSIARALAEQKARNEARRRGIGPRDTKPSKPAKGKDGENIVRSKHLAGAKLAGLLRLARYLGLIRPERFARAVIERAVARLIHESGSGRRAK